MRTADYVELHAHTAFSFQDGASQPTEMVMAAAELGYTHFAVTDHDSLAGAMEFAQACAAADIRGIIGAEVTVAEDFGGDDAHVTLIARTFAGYSNLCRLITAAYQPKVPRSHLTSKQILRETPAGRVPNEKTLVYGGADRPHPTVTMEQLLAHAEGLTCLTGCATRGLLVGDIAADRLPRARAKLEQLRDGFEPGRVFVELQIPMQQGDSARNRALRMLAETVGVPLVATGNVHAHTRLRTRLHEALVAIRLNTSLEACEFERAGNLALQLVSPEAMIERFRDYPEAVANTRRIAESVEFDLNQGLGYRYPGMSEDVTGEAIARLTSICHERLDVRYAGMATYDQARDRLHAELALIEKHQLAGFFLLHRDVLELAREVARDIRGDRSARALEPPGRGRGSSVESVICYLSGLSHIDPLQHDLKMGRFLNEDLNSVPDIDLDFPRDIRHELLKRVFVTYGDRCAMVAAHATFRARSAIRGLGKALGLPEGELQSIARHLDRWDTKGASGRAEGQVGPRWEAFRVLANEIADLPRQIGLHSGGIVIATQPICDFVPMQPAATAGRQMCQWDKDSCSDAGFLKIDVLGLGMLSSVEECVETVSAELGYSLDLSRIDYEEAAVYDQIQEGDTVGTFQIESRAQITSVQRVKPRNLQDLTVQVAIIRPGPVVGKSVNPFIEARERIRADPSAIERIDYGHPSLKPVLYDTHGAIIYQDQVIEVSMAFAGFTASQADGLRRAMSRKRSAEALESFRTIFVENAIRIHADGEHPVDEALALRLFDKLIGFSQYGFPRAHSAAFAVLAYQSAWLRHHWGAHWYVALLNAQPMGFYPANALLGDAKRHDIQSLPVDIEISDVLCTVERTGEDGSGRAIRLGLAFVKGISFDEAAALVAERDANGPFTDIADLARRASGLRMDQLEALVRAGVTERLGGSRREQLWEVGTVARAVREQAPLELPAGEAPELAQLSLWDEVVADFAATGMSTRAHPMALLRDVLPPGVLTTEQVQQARNGEMIETAGVLIAVQRPGTAKGVTFVLLEDECGTVNAVFTPQHATKVRPRLRSERIVRVRGVVQWRKGILSIQANELHLVPNKIRAAANNIPVGKQYS
jgi:error-prone DNA polymerase